MHTIITNNGAMGMDIYDIIIIGGGAAGMSAAIYAMRADMKTLVLERLATGGQAAKTYEIDNYPGFYNPPSGPDLMADFKSHAEKLGAQIRTEAVREIINIDGDIKTVKTRRGEYNTKTVIFALGASPKKLGVKGEAELTGAGVSYCATCDGAFFKGLDTAVIGGGNTAMEDALYLSRFASHVTILNRSKRFRASKVLLDKAYNNPNITILSDTVAEEFLGDMRLDTIITKNTQTGEMGELKANGVIIAVGITPDTELAKKCGVALSEDGFIITDTNLKTNIDGVYAAGDCRVSPLRQVVTAAADGAVSATSAINYLMQIGD